ncbi:MAG: hypothetical protein IPF46_06965 [Saprospiraceae bacterium]|nr:hypothetical protein [Candidatus Vicinibacter affinis]
MKHTLFIQYELWIQFYLIENIKFQILVFDKIIILGIILFLINMTFVPYKGLNVIKVNSKSEVTDHVKNHVQANTFNHEFNINNPKESKTHIVMAARDKNDKDLDQNDLYLDSLLVSIRNDKLKNSTKLKLNINL